MKKSLNFYPSICAWRISKSQRKNKYEVFEIANDTLLDEVIGITGKVGDKIVFVDNLYFPDIFSSNGLKKSEVEEYVVFSSDMQVGSKVFYEKNFLKFIEWLNGDYGTKEQREVAKSNEPLPPCDQKTYSLS